MPEDGQSLLDYLMYMEYRYQEYNGFDKPITLEEQEEMQLEV